MPSACGSHGIMLNLSCLFQWRDGIVSEARFIVSELDRVITRDYITIPRTAVVLRQVKPEPLWRGETSRALSEELNFASSPLATPEFGICGRHPSVLCGLLQGSAARWIACV